VNRFVRRLFQQNVKLFFVSLNSLETQMELEGRAIAHHAGSPNGKEGVQAFLEKRKPKFS